MPLLARQLTYSVGLDRIWEIKWRTKSTILAWDFISPENPLKLPVQPTA
jgi:hypothetical protein